MNRGLVAFSADPPTFGHVDLITRAASKVDELIVGIAVNAGKSPLFTLQEKKGLTERALSYLGNVRVVSVRGMLADYAYKEGIPTIIKGVRNATDVEYERTLDRVGKSQHPGIDTELLDAKPEHFHIASSIAKEIQRAQGNLRSFVPLHVKQALEARISSQYIVGVTGEAGSGKSFMTKELVSIGKKDGFPAGHIEFDLVARRVIKGPACPGYRAVRRKIADTFGQDVLLPNGDISREILRYIVFGDQEKVAELDRIMREPMDTELRTTELFEEKNLLFFDAAIAAEKDWLYVSNNNTVLVTAPRDMEQFRLQKKGWSDEHITGVWASQYTAAEKEKAILEAIHRDRNGHLWTIRNYGPEHPGQLQALFNDIVRTVDVYGELRFRALWSRLGCDGTPDEAYTRILAAYSRPDRVWHNMPHVVEWADEWEGAKGEMDFPDAVLWGGFLHDIEKKLKSRVDEERSGRISSSVAENALLAKDVCDYMRRIVVEGTSHDKIPSFKDAWYASDLDLVRFGHPPALFDLSERDIREEYWYVPWDEFREARGKILQERFLDKPTIYLTKHFQDRYEKQAQENLKRRVKELLV